MAHQGVHPHSLFPPFSAKEDDGYSLRLELVAGQVHPIPPPRTISEGSTFPRCAFQTLHVAAHYCATLKEFVTVLLREPELEAAITAKGLETPFLTIIAQATRAFIREGYAQPPSLSGVPLAAYRVWAAFTFCYFRGVHKAVSCPKNAVDRKKLEDGAIEDGLASWLKRLVGHTGWQQGAGAGAGGGLRSWVAGMWQRLSLDPNVRAAALADQIPERTVVQRPASNEAEAKYTPIYPLYLTNGYDRNRYKLSELSPNNIAVTGGACGVPAGYSSSSNSAIGLLALSDMLAAFKQAVEGKPKDDKSRLASALRDEVLQRASAPPADQPDPLSSAEHAAYRPHLTACVLGWADALDCTARWVDSAAQCAAQAGIGSPQAPVLPAAALLQLLSDQPEMPPVLQATGSPLPSPYNLSRPESPLAGGEGQPLREFCSRSTNPSPPLASPQHSAPSPTARAASAALAAAAFCGTRPSGSMELINTGVGQLALAESGQLPHAPTPLGVLRQLRVVLAHAAVTAEPLAASHPALAQGVRALQASVAAAVQAAEAGAAEGPLRPPVTSWGAARVEAGPGTAAGPSDSQWAPAAAGRADGMMGLMESSLGGGMEASLWGAPYAAAAAPQQLVAQGAGQLQGTLPSSAASGPAQPGHNAGREVELASGLTAAMSAPPALFNRRLGSALKANSACAINDSGSGSGFQQFLTDILAPGSTLAGAAAGAAGGSQEARVPTGPACPPRRPPQPMGIFQGSLIPGFDQAYPAGAPCAAGGGGAMAMETSQGGLSAAAPLAHALTAPPAMAARPVPPVQPPPMLPPPPVPPPPRRNVFDDPNLLPPGPLPAPMLRGPSDHAARPCDRSRERERSGAHGRGGWDERGERSRGYDLLSPGTDGLPADVYMSLGSLADLEHFGSIVAEGPGALAGGRF